MESTKYRQTLTYMLQTLCKNGIVEWNDAAMIYHMVKTEEEAKTLVQYLLDHPEVTTQMLLQKTVEVIKAEWVDPDQI